MRNVFGNYRPENFRNSGYISHPRRERRSSWTFSPAPRTPFHSTNAVRDALQRRERAYLKTQSKPSFFKTLLMPYSIDDTIAPTTASGHVPVLLRETLELFGPSRGFKL